MLTLKTKFKFSVWLLGKWDKVLGKRRLNKNYIVLNQNDKYEYKFIGCFIIYIYIERKRLYIIHVCVCLLKIPRNNEKEIKFLGRNGRFFIWIRLCTKLVWHILSYQKLREPSKTTRIWQGTHLISPYYTR